MQSRALSCRKYTLNDASFSTLESDAKYWMGVLATDGCIHQEDGPKSPIVVYKVKDIDSDSVSSFLTFVGSNAPVSFGYSNKEKTRRYASGRIASKQIVADLKANGIGERKSFTLEVSNALAESPDFWRGAIDGDGSISLNFHVENGTTYYSPRVTLSSGSEKFASQFKNFAEKIVGSTSEVRTMTTKTNKTQYRVSVNGNRALSLLSQLGYTNELLQTLERKRQKAKLLLEKTYLKGEETVN